MREGVREEGRKEGSNEERRGGEKKLGVCRAGM